MMMMMISYLTSSGRNCVIMEEFKAIVTMKVMPMEKETTDYSEK